MIADFGQRTENGRKVPPSINGEQIFNIFKDKPFGSIFGRRAFEQSNDLKKERASFSGKPSLSARNRNVLTRESSRPEVDPRQVCGRDSGNIFSIPLILLYIVYGTVAAVCEFVSISQWPLHTIPQSSKPLRKPPTPLKKSKKVIGSFNRHHPFCAGG